MKHTLLVLALLTVPFAARAADTPVAAQSQPNYVAKTYTVRYLGDREFTNLVIAARGTDQNVRWSNVAPGKWLVSATPALHDTLPKLLSEIDVAPRTFVFRVHLLLEDGDGQQPKLPEEAAKALRDLQAFMPNRSFRVLDSLELRSMNKAHGDLAGAYALNLEFHGDGAEGSKLVIDNLSLMGRGVTLITSLAITPGETVVVGTSRTAEGKSLVLLLTALEPK